MDRFISRVNYAKRVLNYVFPSPREVDRFISLGVSASSVNQWSFRPLARWIGLYLDELKNYDSFAIEFPSPREVDRFISNVYLSRTKWLYMFPSPREVDRFISQKQ